MEFEEQKALICLAQKQDWCGAAAACGVSVNALKALIDSLEQHYRQAIVEPGDPFQGFTPQGARILNWARDYCLQISEVQQQFGDASRQTLVAELLERRSVSPKRLCAPGPSPQDLRWMAQAGLHAPDHGGLHPWRLLEFRPEQRQALADAFEAEKRRRDPLSSDEDIQRAREHAIRPPMLLAFIVSPQSKTQVPVREQWLAAGAAIGNVLNAAHQLGFGAIVLSGERCFDAGLCAELGVQPHEFLAGFISLGSVAQVPPARGEKDPEAVISCWTPMARTVDLTKADTTNHLQAVAPTPRAAS